MNLYKEAIDELGFAFSEQIAYIPDELYKRYISMLAVMRTEIRFYYLNRDLAIEKIWYELRQVDDIMHLHLNITNDWLARTLGRYTDIDYTQQDELYGTLCDIISVSLAKDPITLKDVYNTYQRDDSEFYSKVSTRRDLKQLLVHEPWLVVLVLILRNLSCLVKPIKTPTDTTTPHSVTKTQIGSGTKSNS